MKAELNFNSSHYYKINWSEIIAQCCENTYLLFNNNYALIPYKKLNNKNISFVDDKNILYKTNENLEAVGNTFFQDGEICVVRINLGETSRVSVSVGAYLQKIHSIACAAYKQVCDILQYTADHLATRTAENIPIIQHENTQLEIANIICELASVSKNLQAQVSLIDLNLVFERLILSLYSLSLLGGGRVILRGNAHELMYYLRLFKIFYLDNKIN